MILELVDSIIIECIPPKKYSHEWDESLLNKKLNEIFEDPQLWWNQKEIQ